MRSCLCCGDGLGWCSQLKKVQVLYHCCVGIVTLLCCNATLGDGYMECSSIYVDQILLFHVLKLYDNFCMITIITVCYFNSFVMGFCTFDIHCIQQTTVVGCCCVDKLFINVLIGLVVFLPLEQ